MRARDLQHHSQRPLGGPRALLERPEGGLGVSMDVPRALQSSLGLLWGVCWEALGVSWGAFFAMFLVQGGIRSENDEMLENDDPLNEFAMFLEPKGLQNETKMVPEEH